MTKKVFLVIENLGGVYVPTNQIRFVRMYRLTSDIVLSFMTDEKVDRKTHHSRLHVQIDSQIQ